MCVLYSYLDASTEEYTEEEEVYFQEEEDHFDQYTTQGKLILLLSAKLYQSKAPPLFYFMLNDPNPSFTLQALMFLVYQSLLLVHDSLGLE